MAKRILSHPFSEPLSGAATAKININAGTGNLTIDRLASGEQLLASGTLEYMEGQEPPGPSVSKSNGQAAFTLKAEGGRQPSFRMPWSSCNAETNWQIHLSPAVSSDITVHSGGGNIKLGLSGMAVTGVSADTGGGNVEVVLPNDAANQSVCVRTGGGNVTVEVGNSTRGINILEARSGAGNVSVRVPPDLAARIHATTGMGKAIIDPRFTKVDSGMYQSADYDGAADKVEISIKSGAGNVSVITR